MSASTKACPACGQSNPEVAILCQSCGADISGAIGPRSGGESPPARRWSDQAPSQHTLFEPRQVKICPRCAAQNDSIDILCGTCGESVREVLPSPAAAEAAASSRDTCSHVQQVTMLEPTPPKLWLVVGSQSFECKSGDVLGRTGTVACQVFAGIPTVSARHVALELRDRVWHMVNLPTQPGRPGKNITQIDGREVPIGSAVALTTEHVLRLSTRCEVHLRVSSS
jgi:hypothetical protein